MELVRQLSRYRSHHFEKYSFEKNAFKGSNTITANKISTHRQSYTYSTVYLDAIYAIKKIRFFEPLTQDDPLKVVQSSFET